MIMIAPSAPLVFGFWYSCIIGYVHGSSPNVLVQLASVEHNYGQLVPFLFVFVGVNLLRHLIPLPTQQ